MAPAYPPVAPLAAGGTPLLEVAGLSRPRSFRNVSLTLRPGEVLGITGLLGSGRTELALALFGLNPAASGTIRVAGRPARIRSVRDAMRLGIAYVPEDRLRQGLVLHQSVARNLLLTVLRRLPTRFGLLDLPRLRERVAGWIDAFRIRVASPQAPIETLSGGNQQRVVLAKWIAMDPRILILDNPTVGIDIAAKSGIHAAIRGLAARGMGIIIISDEAAELVHTCNRVAVMAKGRLGPAVEAERLTVQALAGAVAGDPVEVAP